MKKFLLLAVVVLVVLTSCATSLNIRYAQPSNLDMGAYRNIAITSCVEYPGTQNIPLYIRLEAMESLEPSLAKIRTIVSSYEYKGLNKAAAAEVTTLVEKSFGRSNYYRILGHEKTDAYMALAAIGRDPSVELLKDGYDAVIIPKITALRTDEWITREKVKVNGVETWNYYLNRLMDMTVNLTVLDTRTNQVVAVQTYHNTEKNREKFDPITITTFPNRLTALAHSVVDDMSYDIVSDFVPRTLSTSVALMSNKPKNEQAKLGYEAADNGNYLLAERVFTDVYRSTGHVPSGYNMAVIAASTGDLDGAIGILGEMRMYTPNKKVNTLYYDLLDIKGKDERAKQQIDGSSAALQPLGQDMTIYDYLLH